MALKSQHELGSNIPIIDSPVVKSTGSIRPSYKPSTPVVTYIDPVKKTIERKRLSDREYKYIQYRAEGAEKKEALLKAGYSVTAVQMDEDMLESKPYILEFLNKLPEYLKQAGINDNYLAQKFHEWLNAVKTIKIVKEQKVVMGETGPTSETTYRKITDPDYDTQLKALDRLEKLTSIGQAAVTEKITFERFIGTPQKKE